MGHQGWPLECGWIGDWIRFDRWTRNVVPEGDAAPDTENLLGNIYILAGANRRSMTQIGELFGADLTPDSALDRIRDVLVDHLMGLPNSQGQCTVQLRATRLIPRPADAPRPRGQREDEEEEEEQEEEEEESGLPPEEEDPSLDGEGGEDEDDDDDEDGDPDGDEPDGDDPDGDDPDGDDPTTDDFEEVPWPEATEPLTIFSRAASASAPASARQPEVSQPAPGSRWSPAGAPSMVTPPRPAPSVSLPTFGSSGPGAGFGGQPAHTPSQQGPTPMTTQPGPSPAMPAVPMHGGMGPGMMMPAQGHPGMMNPLSVMPPQGHMMGPAAPQGPVGWNYPSTFEFPQGMVPIPTLPLTPELLQRPDLLYAMMQNHIIMTLVGEQRYLLQQNSAALNTQASLFEKSLKSTRKDRKRADKQARREHEERLRAMQAAAAAETQRLQDIMGLKETTFRDQLTREREIQDQVQARIAGDLSGQTQAILEEIRSKPGVPPKPPASKFDRLKEKVVGLAEIAVDEVARGTVEGLAKANKAGSAQPQPASGGGDFPPPRPGYRWEWANVRTQAGVVRSLVEMPIGAPVPQQAPPPQQYASPPQQQQYAPPQQQYAAPPQGYAPPQHVPAPPPPQYAAPVAPVASAPAPVAPVAPAAPAAPAAGMPDLSELMADPSKLAFFLDFMSEEQRTQLIQAIAASNPERAVSMAEQMLTTVRDS